MSNGKKVLIGCGGLAVFGFLFVGCAAAFIAISEPPGDRVSEETPQSPGESAEMAADTGENGGSGEMFTRENYAELVANPDDHEGSEVDIVGRVFTDPESEGDESFFQMWADPENSEWNTIVRVVGVDVARDDYVRVQGEVIGSFEGENPFGATLAAPAVEADAVEAVEAVEAIDPATEVREVGATLSDQGFSITVDRVEFGENTTRVYLAAANDTSANASFYTFNSVILQEGRQIEGESSFSFDVPEPQSDLRPGVTTDGAVVFGPVDSSQPFQIEFGWYSDDFEIEANPIVFNL